MNLTPSAIRALAARHGIRPAKSLGQHFLIEPALARRIVELSGVGPKSRVLEVGAGIGSLTVALARTGASVLAVELDRRLLPALEEVVASYPGVRVVAQDALKADWQALLGPTGDGWVMVANLPYNVSVPVVLRILELEPRIAHFLVMVQKEVGERLTAGPGHPQYGAVSVRVAYRAEGRVARRVSRTVFWPEPNVDSVLVELRRRPPPVEVDEAALWTVVAAAFEQRRKILRSALVRLGLDAERAGEILAACGIDPKERAERVGLEGFACLARAWMAAGGEGTRV